MREKSKTFLLHIKKLITQFVTISLQLEHLYTVMFLMICFTPLSELPHEITNCVVSMIDLLTRKRKCMKQNSLTMGVPILVSTSTVRGPFQL